MRFGRTSNLLVFCVFAAALVGFSGVAVPRDSRKAEATSQTIMETLSRSKDHTILVAGLKASGLADALQGSESLTIFAPTNQAFAKLPGGAVDNLFKSENRPQLKTILSYHVLKGALTAKDLAERIGTGGGKTELETLQGETLTIEKDGRVLKLTDVKGDTATVTSPDIAVANGVVFNINGVLLP